MIRGKSISKLVTVIALSAFVGACADNGRPTTGGFFTRQDVPLENFTAAQIFERGEFELEENNLSEAAFFFSEIERLYPFSDFAERALIMQAFSYHRDRDYPNSRAAAQRFIDFYPDADDAAYAQYLLALSYYDQIDEVGRDQGLTFQALQSLREVIEVYPDSVYAKSAILKFDLAFNHLANKEMEIGRYYLRRDNFTAAINRFRVGSRIFRPQPTLQKRCTAWSRPICPWASRMRRRQPGRSLGLTTSQQNGMMTAINC